MQSAERSLNLIERDTTRRDTNKRRTRQNDLAQFAVLLHKPSPNTKCLHDNTISLSAALPLAPFAGGCGLTNNHERSGETKDIEQPLLSRNPYRENRSSINVFIKTEESAWARSQLHLYVSTTIALHHFPRRSNAYEHPQANDFDNLPALQLSERRKGEAAANQN